MDNGFKPDLATFWKRMTCFSVKLSFYLKINDIRVKVQVPTNLVPAVAVRRGGPVLVVLIGRKGCVDGFFELIGKDHFNCGDYLLS